MNVSIVRIHFGSSPEAPSRGRPRHCLTATNTSSRPSTIFSQSTHVAGSASSLAPAVPATTSTIAPTTARPSIQPATNAGPLTRARGVPSISTTAMIGTGLSATPTPNERTWPIVSCTAQSSRTTQRKPM